MTVISHRKSHFKQLYSPKAAPKFDYNMEICENFEDIAEIFAVSPNE